MTGNQSNTKQFVLYENGQVVMRDGKPVFYSPGAFCLIWRALRNGDREILCVKANDKVLSDKKVEQGKWGLPGGGVNFPHEDSLSGVVREVKEEVGFRIFPDNINVLGNFGQFSPYDLYSYEWLGGRPKISLQETELQDYDYFLLSKIVLEQERYKEMFYPAQWKSIGWWLLYECNSLKSPFRGKGITDPWAHPVLASLRQG